ncbi:hypothetical protein EZJ49_12915 [Bdellovibrio bacteriovorus]|nr:hypothetical protein [Bdellovibrio bacteriovorus]UXR63967.1 hypothetical protein EZJ49_12915 [Bdellovibrio bacteriovorus]
MNTDNDSQKAEKEVRVKTLWVLGLTFVLPVLITLAGIYYVLYTEAK